MITKNVIVIGGGFAGLSAATALAERGVRVTLLEGRQILGGRAYSFLDPGTGDAVDNGQHLFMGCYRQTRAFLRRIGTLDRLAFQRNLSVDFVGSGGRRARLRCLPLQAPWHLLSGLAGLSTLSWPDRWRMLKMREALQSAEKNPNALDQITVEKWLKRWNQSDRARRHLWDLIAIAALNEDPRIAAAGPFVAVLARAFFGGPEESQLGFSRVGLSALYDEAGPRFIESRGGEARSSSPVERLLIRDGLVTGIQLRTGERLKADWVISAVPAPALLKLLPDPVVESEPVFKRLRELRASPIISLHLWFDRAISPLAFAGLLDTHIQWFFNKSKILSGAKSAGYVSVVISGAHAFIDWPEAQLLALALEELRRLFPPARAAALVRSRVIKEHQAALSPGVGGEALRPGHQSPLRNLLLAGDWTKTGLPATIESACMSGHACADIIVQCPTSKVQGQDPAASLMPDQKTLDFGHGTLDAVYG